MKKYFWIMIVLTIFSVSPSWAGIMATDEQMSQLKEDIAVGRFEIGNTRLKEFVSIYGDAPTITDSDKKVIYDYGNMKLEFEKIRYMREWGYDSSKQPAYTDKIKKLRHDLEAQLLVGDQITLEKVYKDYDPPTEKFENTIDGNLSVYYYGDIKLTFENFFVLKSWKSSPSKITKPKVAEAPKATEAPAVAEAPKATEAPKTAEAAK